MKNRIYITGGYVKSINDGEKHFIEAHTVAKLYNIHVRHKNVILINNEYKTQDYTYLEGDVFLSPDSSGNYILSDFVRQKVDKILNNK